ncbi:MAG: DUF4870 domain-containing protein [Planctomycetes bacterium]|nr:DUF4870 domain-containing protein [Planctomycetota bacterium]
MRAGGVRQIALAPYDQHMTSNFDQATTPSSVDAPSSEDKTLALVAHLLGILTWFVGALIIWLIHKDQPSKQWVNSQAKEALNFQITISIGYVISVVLFLASLGLLFFLPGLLALINLVLCIVAGVKAHGGETYRYPFTLRLIS